VRAIDQVAQADWATRARCVGSTTCTRRSSRAISTGSFCHRLRVTSTRRAARRVAPAGLLRRDEIAVVELLRGRSNGSTVEGGRNQLSANSYRLSALTTLNHSGRFSCREKHLEGSS
jgi:hypothetical protein